MAICCTLRACLTSADCCHEPHTWQDSASSVWHKQVLKDYHLCSHIRLEKVETGDIIHMVSLQCGAHGRITGMMASRRLIEPLIHGLAAHQEDFRRRLLAQGIFAATEEPDRLPEGHLAAQLLAGTRPESH
jgi:hypothetical protein